MSFDWCAYYRLSEALLQDPEALLTGADQEAVYRAAISRVYYAVFKVAYNRFINSGWSEPKHEVHRWVVDRLKSYNDRSASRQKIEDFRRAGEDLDRLRLYRRSADYDNDFQAGNKPQDPSRIAQIALKTAKRTLELITKHP